MAAATSAGSAAVVACRCALPCARTRPRCPRPLPAEIMFTTVYPGFGLYAAFRGLTKPRRR
eukprot:4183078-Prymnesium_polylepis.1